MRAHDVSWDMDSGNILPTSWVRLLKHEEVKLETSVTFLLKQILPYAFKETFKCFPLFPEAVTHQSHLLNSSQIDLFLEFLSRLLHCDITTSWNASPQLFSECYLLLIYKPPYSIPSFYRSIYYKLKQFLHTFLFIF